MAGWEVCVACGVARVDAPELCRDSRPHRIARYIFHPVAPPEDPDIEWIEPPPDRPAPVRASTFTRPVAQVAPEPDAQVAPDPSASVAQVAPEPAAQVAREPGARLAQVAAEPTAQVAAEPHAQLAQLAAAPAEQALAPAATRDATPDATPILPTAAAQPGPYLDLTPSAMIPLDLSPSDPLVQDPLSLAPFEVPYDPLSSISAPAVMPMPELNIEPLDAFSPLDIMPLEMAGAEPGTHVVPPAEQRQPVVRQPIASAASPLLTPREVIVQDAPEYEAPTLVHPPPPRLPNPGPAAARRADLAPHQKGPGGIPFDATFLARYRPLGVLGKGGAGIVYRVVECATGREAALKFLVHLEKTAVARFQAECQTLSKLDHPRVLAVMGTGQWKSFPYLLTEVVEGETLKDRLLAEGSLTVRGALQATIHILEGLEYLHAQGVVHRDLKPANIFLIEGGGLKIGDFGVARTPWRQSALTEPGTVVGTPRYMSPEQATGDPITFASDIYSLGVVLFELLTGRPPFVAPSLAALLSAHVRKKQPMMRSLRPELPDELEPVIARALEKKPAKRYASAADFARALQALLDAKVEALVPHGPAPELSGSDSAILRPTSERAEGSAEVAVLPAVPGVRDPSQEALGPSSPEIKAALLAAGGLGLGPGGTSGPQPAAEKQGPGGTVATDGTAGASGFGAAVTLAPSRPGAGEAPGAPGPSSDAHPVGAPAAPAIRPPRRTVERPVVAPPRDQRLPAPRETNYGHLPSKPMERLLANLPWVVTGFIALVLVLMALAGAH